jgi:hypothetical protein
VKDLQKKKMDLFSLFPDHNAILDSESEDEVWVKSIGLELAKLDIKTISDS